MPGQQRASLWTAHKLTEKYMIDKPGLPTLPEVSQVTFCAVFSDINSMRPFLNFNCCYCCSVTQSCLTLCDPMDCSTPGLLVHHQLPGLAQTHVHWVGDAIQPSHPLSSPSPPAFNLSQHQGLFQWVSSSHQVAKVLELELQHQSFQCIFRVDFLYNWLVWSPCSPRDPQESSPAPQSKSICSLVLSLLYGLTLTSILDCWKNHSFDYPDLCWQSSVSAF